MLEGPFYWKSIEVIRQSGPPRLRLNAGAAAQASALGVTDTFLTLTHSQTLALAQVILVRNIETA